jgi:tetraacyldisaccharide 4'-kinase
LREPVRQGLSRADAVVLVGDGNPDLQGFSGPVLRAQLIADGTAFDGQSVFAFAGIGRPGKFFAALEQAGAQMMGSCAFPDHHPYTEEELLQLRAVAGDAQLVTTEKDFVRMTIAQREGIRVLKVAAVFDPRDTLAGLLDRALGAV